MMQNNSDIDFIALVKNDNRASHSLFVKAGFGESRDFENIPMDHTMYLFKTKDKR